MVWLSLQQTQTMCWPCITARRFLRLSSSITWGYAQNLTPANDSAAIMIISCLVSAYELSPRLLRPLSEVSEKSITICSKFWDRTLSWSSQSFLSYNGTMWFLLHALNIWTVPLAESWFFRSKTSNLATLTKRKQGKFWSLDRGIPWRQHTSNMT